MRVTIKAIGPLKKYMDGQPETILEFDQPLSVNDILKQLQINQEDITMVTIEGKCCSLDYVPSDGDELVLIPIILGG